MPFNRLANKRNEVLVRENREAIEAARASTQQLETKLQALQRQSSEVEQEKRHLEKVLFMIKATNNGTAICFNADCCFGFRVIQHRV